MDSDNKKDTNFYGTYISMFWPKFENIIKWKGLKKCNYLKINVQFYGEIHM